MANHNNARNRNRSGFHQEWDNDDNRNYPATNVENQRRRYNSPYRGRDYGNVYGNDRNRSDYEGEYNRGNFGNSYDMNRGYSGREDYRESNDWNNRSYTGNSGSDYGRDRYTSDQYRGEDRDWWDRTKDEVSSWFGDDEAQHRRRMDERRGEHRGKGPKGYTRTDERIKDDVNDRLSDDPGVDASDIEVMVEKSEVTLTGTVRSRWEKRHAEDVAEDVSGVKNVENRLRVSASGVTPGTTGTSPVSLGSTYEPGKKPVSAYENSKS